MEAQEQVTNGKRATLRQIILAGLSEGKNWQAIADDVNAQGYKSSRGNPWSQGGLWTVAVRSGWAKRKRKHYTKPVKPTAQAKPVKPTAQAEPGLLQVIEDIMTSPISDASKLFLIKKAIS